MQPWWSIRDAAARSVAKKQDAQRRGIHDDEGAHQYRRLCRKFKLRHDDRIKATMADDKLVLSRGIHHYPMQLDLYDHFYLSQVLEILARDKRPISSRSTAETERLPDPSAEHRD